MTKSTTTAADSENRKSQLILVTARQLFLEQGYDQSSMDQIARSAGVSKATLYVYFPSKEALLLALIEDDVKTMDPGPMWEPGSDIPDVVSALRGIAEKFTALFLTDRRLALHRLVTSQAIRFPEVGHAFYEAGPKKVHAEISEFFRAAHKANLVSAPDIDLAVMHFLSLVKGDLPMNWALSLDPPSDKQLSLQIEAGIRVFLAAYGRTAKSGCA